MLTKLRRFFGILAMVVLLPASWCVWGAESQDAKVQSEASCCSYRTVYPDWSAMTPEAMQQVLSRNVEEVEAVMAGIRRVEPQQACWENTFAPFAHALEQMEFMGAASVTMAHVCSDAESAQRYQALSEEILLHVWKAYSDVEIWRVLKAAAASPAVQSLTAQQKNAIDIICRMFINNGTDLPAEVRARSMEIARELVQLSYQYQSNITASLADIQLHVKENLSRVNGTPSYVLRKARNNAKAVNKKGFLFLAQDNTLYQLMTKSKNEEMRRAAWEAWARIAQTPAHDNAALAARILALRHEVALLEGYDTYAEASGTRRMLSTGKQALSFIDEMMRRVKPAFEAELAKQLSLYNEVEHKQLQALPPWELPYAEVLYRDKYLLPQGDDIDIYLQQENVLKGMLSFFEKLYSLRIQERETSVHPGAKDAAGVDVWHPDVRCFDVYDRESSALLGVVYSDMLARAGKTPGGQASFVRASADRDLPHLVVIILNMEDEYLSLQNVEDLFHEWGHALHFVMGQGCIGRQNANMLENDFLEFASTFAAYWALEPQILAEFARHPATGEPCPPEILQEACHLHAKQNPLIIMEYLRDFKVDIEMHLYYEQKFKNKDFNEACYGVVKDWMAPLTGTPPSHLLIVPHCMNGLYGSNFYSYMLGWVTAADALTRFRTPSGFDFSVGREFRREFLEKGASVPAAEMFRNFMGRQPQVDAYLEYRGLKGTANE